MLSSSSADATAAEKNSDGTVTVRYKPVSYTHLDVYKRQPYYPVNDEKNGALYAAYKQLADAEPGRCV